MVKSKIPIGYKDRTVCILGLGFVGLTLAAIMAEAGFHIIGVEIREDILKKLESRIAHFYEPGLTDAMQRAVKNGRLEVHNAIPPDCGATVYIITVGTPLDAQGRVNLDDVTRIAVADEVIAKHRAQNGGVKGLTSSQIRAARALLRWSAGDLARGKSRLSF